jgi:hypothetical protein
MKEVSDSGDFLEISISKSCKNSLVQNQMEGVRVLTSRRQCREKGERLEGGRLEKLEGS